MHSCVFISGIKVFICSYSRAYRAFSTTEFVCTEWIITFTNNSTNEVYQFVTDYWGQDRSQIKTALLGTKPTGTYKVEFDGADFGGYDYYIGGNWYSGYDDKTIYNVVLTEQDTDIYINRSF